MAKDSVANLQKQMAQGRRNVEDLNTRIHRGKVSDMQRDQQLAKEAAETRADWKQSNKKNDDSFGKTALQGSTRYGGTMRRSWPDFYNAPTGRFKGGSPRSKMSASLKIK